MKKICFISSLAIMLLAIPLIAIAGGDWYEGGTLYRATVSEWNSATYSNKMATAADWAISRPAIKAKVKRSGSLKTLKPFAIALVECVNEAAAGESPGNNDVVELAAACMILMGWN